MRLFAFPHAGGGAAETFGLRRALAPAVELVPVALPGRDALFREPPLTSHAGALAYLRGTLFDALEPPFALYGHSMGAHVAFEVARELRRVGRPGPVRLCVSAAPAPQFGPPRPYAHLPDDRFVERLRTLGGTPDEVLADPGLLAFVLPRLRGDFALSESYRYADEPPLDCPISVWGGRADAYSVERLRAWGEQTRAGFALRMLDGGHFFVRDNEAAMAAALRADLAAAPQQVAA
ncbi:MAG TPA: alpha/beta fold hydrolase [Solirubrobacteraceae bacterium]|jgi:medium-chain acyl-[acyl-carrier-protein] hydrolase|nr:alpha/beta fold hydrolase [Solirubrobacteraceae bacterium]